MVAGNHRPNLRAGAARRHSLDRKVGARTHLAKYGMSSAAQKSASIARPALTHALPVNRKCA